MNIGEADWYIPRSCDQFSPRGNHKTTRAMAWLWGLPIKHTTFLKYINNTVPIHIYLGKVMYLFCLPLNFTDKANYSKNHFPKMKKKSLWFFQGPSGRYQRYLLGEKDVLKVLIFSILGIQLWKGKVQKKIVKRYLDIWLR